MSKFTENKRQSADKLDGLIVPLIAFSASIIASTALEQSNVLGNLSVLFFVIAVFAHYLSVETEARVLMNRKNAPSRLYNSLTGIFNNVRLLSLSLGFIVLLTGIARSL